MFTFAVCIQKSIRYNRPVVVIDRALTLFAARKATAKLLYVQQLRRVFVTKRYVVLIMILRTPRENRIVSHTLRFTHYYYYYVMVLPHRREVGTSSYACSDGHLCRGVFIANCSSAIRARTKAETTYTRTCSVHFIFITVYCLLVACSQVNGVSLHLVVWPFSRARVLPSSDKKSVARGPVLTRRGAVAATAVATFGAAHRTRSRRRVHCIISCRVRSVVCDPSTIVSLESYLFVWIEYYYKNPATELLKAVIDVYGTASKYGVHIFYKHIPKIVNRIISWSYYELVYNLLSIIN